MYQDALQKIGDGDKTTIRIPVENSSDNLNCFVEIIDDYYSEDRTKKKLFERQQDKETGIDFEQDLSLIHI